MKGDYDVALEGFQRCADAEDGDSLNVSDSLSVGITLLCMERYDDAARHFEELIKRTQYTVSHHRVYLGLAHWARGDDEAAVKIWMRAQKSQYMWASGADVHFVLWYACACRPDLIDKKQVAAGMEKHLSRYTCDFTSRVMEFFLGRLSEENVIEIAHEVEGHYVAQIVRSNLTLLEFAFATADLHHGDSRGYRRHLQNCANIDDCVDEMFPIFFARVEMAAIERRVRKWRSVYCGEGIK
jgi:hypothetical protein